MKKTGPAVMAGVCLAAVLGIPMALRAQGGPVGPDPRQPFVGSWRLVSLEEMAQGGNVETPDCSGQFIFTADGHAAVQVMYHNAGAGQSESTQYARGGYEATFGRYTVDDTARTFTFHVDGALVRTLIGKDLRRRFTFTGDQLIVEPSDPNEHWRVVWARDKERVAMNVSDDLRTVSPALERYATTTLDGLWKRPGLSPRDRSLVTVAALIARQQTPEMPFHMARALDNGIKPSELSEVITHLAFYSGWGNAMTAVEIANDVFTRRSVGPKQLPAASPSLLPLDEAGEAARVAQVDQLIGSTSPGLAQYTTEALFRDLWLRPDLAPRDRSLVTVSALIATGQVAQLSAHLNRAMVNGLTEAQAGEVIAHLAFYAGWPNAFSAATTAKDVFAARKKSLRQ